MFGDFGGRDVLDVRLAAVKFLNLPGIGVEPHDGMAFGGEIQSQRQADVTASNDSNLQILSEKMFWRSSGHLIEFSMIGIKAL